ncbi:MAG: symmetrical bis(5'-nucleosyl)-tetraphosphatase [Opitutales bacterium]|nr:symmetrical bis(5'-nucleosyl)-tetraphosphatase [Opitutales bacterium]
MRTWVVGDVHGCYRELRQLLRKIEFRPGEDRIFFLGDLVNGGPQSLEVLQWAFNHATDSVLGNHDVHLLAVAHGQRRQRGKDTLSDILTHPGADKLLKWLRDRPFLIALEKTVLVHAGLSPNWTWQECQQQAKTLEAHLQTSAGKENLGDLWGNNPAHWADCRKATDKLRYSLNIFTRLRVVHKDGTLNNDFKSTLAQCPPKHVPWFAHPTANWSQEPDHLPAPSTPRILHGHWAALGFHNTNGILGLDTGCVWGGALSAYCLEENRLLQVPAGSTL